MIIRNIKVRGSVIHANPRIRPRDLCTTNTESVSHILSKRIVGASSRSVVRISPNQHYVVSGGNPLSCRTQRIDIEGKVRVWSLDNDEHPLKKEVVFCSGAEPSRSRAAVSRSVTSCGTVRASVSPFAEMDAAA